MTGFVTVSAVFATLGGGILLGVLGTHFLTGKDAAAEETNVTIDEIKAVAKLASVEYHLSIVEHVKEGHEWYEWLSAEMLVEMDGMVEGLVDLEKISMERSDPKGAVTIVIPPEAIEIHDPIVDSNKGIRVTTISNPNVFHPLTDKQRNAAVKDAIKKLKKQAIDKGIREKTLEEAKQVITQLLARSGVEAKFAGGREASKATSAR